MADPIDHLNATLEGRYAVERELGEGGMATVYLAKDLRHERQVAIKVLKPELAAELGAQRFLAEIKVTANLAHPHILPLHDSGVGDAFLYYVMPLVEGESLREKLDRKGTLDVDEAIRITREVASALAYAHQRDVIHRDIKPANVLLHQGGALVADFGIALGIGEAGTERLTESGFLMGTPEYISPEQATGEGAIDGRSDQYSLACVLFAMLGGAPPYTGRSFPEILARQLMQSVPAVDERRPETPPAVTRTLKRALSTDPEGRFRSIADFARALSTDDRPSATQDLSLRPDLLKTYRTPLVGRAEQRNMIGGRIRRLREGRGGMVLLGGEPGVGKTRLAEAVLADARKRHALGLIGHCTEMASASPYTPFVEQTEQAASVLPHVAFLEALGDGGPEIARMVPRLQQQFPDIPRPLDLPLEQRQQYLFSRYVEYLERLGRTAPIVLFLDDLHWADESSLLLLQHIARHVGELPVLVLGTYRDVDPYLSGPFGRTLTALTEQRLAETHGLTALPESAVTELLTGLGPGRPPAGISRIMHRETAGNPFFIEEVFHHLKDEGLLIDGEGQWRSDLTTDKLAVPDSVRLVIGHRLDRLGAPAVEMLISAAIIGPRFEIGLLEELQAGDIEPLLDGVDAAEASGLIVPRAAGRVAAYGFAHELIRQTLLERLSLPRRQRAHLRVAEAIEEVYSSDLDRYAADLAHHLYEAGTAAGETKTLRFLSKAGEQSLRAGAFDEALVHFERGLSVVREATPAERANVLKGVGSALRGLGRWSEAVDRWLEVLALYEEAEDATSIATLCRDIVYLLLWLDDDRASAVCARGLAAVGDDPSVQLGYLLATRATVELRLGDFESGMESIRQATELGHRLDAPHLLATALSNEVYDGCWMYFRLNDVIREGETAADVLRGVGDRWELAWVLSLRELASLFGGRPEEAERLGRTVEPLAEELGHFGAWLFHDAAVGQGEWFRTGDLVGFEAYCRHCMDTWGPPGPWYLLGHVLLCQALFWQGQWEGLVDRAVQATSEFPAGISGQYATGLFWGTAFWLKAYLGDDDALEVLEHRRQNVPKVGRPSYGWNYAFVNSAVDGLVTLGEEDRAAELYPLVLDAIDNGFLAYNTGLTETYAGIAASAGGDFTGAEGHFEIALEQSAALPHRLADPETRRWYAWMLTRRGREKDRARAEGLAREAILGYDAIGMPRHVELAKALIVR